MKAPGRGRHGVEAFRQSRLVQDGVVRNIEIIDEAANHIAHMAPDFIAGRVPIWWWCGSVEPVALSNSKPRGSDSTAHPMNSLLSLRQHRGGRRAGMLQRI